MRCMPGSTPAEPVCPLGSVRAHRTRGQGGPSSTGPQARQAVGGARGISWQPAGRRAVSASPSARPARLRESGPGRQIPEPFLGSGPRPDAGLWLSAGRVSSSRPDSPRLGLPPPPSFGCSLVEENHPAFRKWATRDQEIGSAELPDGKLHLHRPSQIAVMRATSGCRAPSNESACDDQHLPEPRGLSCSIRRANGISPCFLGPPDPRQASMGRVRYQCLRL